FVVGGRQHLLLDLLDRHLGRAGGAIRERVLDRAGVSRRGADQRALDVFEQPAGAELEYEVALRLARFLDRVDDHDVAGLSGAALHRGEIGDALPQKLDLTVEELGWDLGLGIGNLQRRPVGDLGLRLYVDGRSEAPGVVIGRREVVVVLRLRDRPDARAGRGVPEPAADVALYRLGQQPFLAEPGPQYLSRHLAGAEAWDLDAAGEIRGRV